MHQGCVIAMLCSWRHLMIQVCNLSDYTCKQEYYKGLPRFDTILDALCLKAELLF